MILIQQINFNKMKKMIRIFWDWVFSKTTTNKKKNVK